MRCGWLIFQLAMVTSADELHGFGKSTLEQLRQADLHEGGRLPPEAERHIENDPVRFGKETASKSRLE